MSATPLGMCTDHTYYKYYKHDKEIEIHFLFLPQNIQSLFISMRGKQYVEILLINMLSCSRLASKIIDMWQFRIEIKYYFVAYFERITEFDTLLH